MQATLYLPKQSPKTIPAQGLVLPDAATGLVGVPAAASALLDCDPNLVDVLASGPAYVVYSVFDCEEDVNVTAMEAVAMVSGVDFDLDDEDSVLRGPVLVVTA